MKYIVIFCIAALAGCATPVTQTKLAVATHNDLLAAAAYATQNGYPARAAVWNAVDTQLTACENAIQASIPTKPNLPANGGVFLATEVAAEAVGSFSGTPAAVRINCEPLPVILFPTVPKLP